MACQSPIMRPSRDGFRDVPVPCGRCPPCLKNRVDSWVFRLKQQEKVSTHSHFITLTYDTQFVPISPNGFMTLCRDAFPLFMKRLRKLCPDFKLSYYACGEYGTEKKRPHYHAIVFNVPTTVLCKHWTDKHSENPKGFSKCGQVNQATIHYVTGYVVTKYGKIDEKTGKSLPTWTADDVKPFALMSKGLGKIYLKHNTKFHKGNFTTTTRLEGGRPALLPRYYRERIFDKIAQQMLCIISREEAEIRQQDPNYNKSEFEKRRFQVLNTQRSILKKSL